MCQDPVQSEAYLRNTECDDVGIHSGCGAGQHTHSRLGKKNRASKPNTGMFLEGGIKTGEPGENTQILPNAPTNL